MTGLKDCKSCQEIISLVLATRNLAEKDEWKFWNQSGIVRSCMLPYTPEIAEKTSFFRFPYLKYHFMIANLV